MTSLSLPAWVLPTPTTRSDDAPPKPDWPLMSDVSSIRAGVPEALIHWRRARGEAPPLPSDPDLR